MSPLEADEAARRTIREDLGRSLWVEAAAGTGKTSELLKRLVAVLAAGTPVGSIVAVTFTHKAAGEIKLRLRRDLDLARANEQSPERKAHLTQALAQLESAMIGTIHAFCGEILRERPVEARLDPSFKEMDDRVRDALFDRSFRRYIEERLASQPEPIARALLRPNPNRGPPWSTPLERLHEAANTLLKARDLAAPWKQQDLNLSEVIDLIVPEALQLADLAVRSQNMKDSLRRGLEPFVIWARLLRANEAERPRDHRALEAELSDLTFKLRYLKEGHGDYAPDLSRAELFKKRTLLLEKLERFVEVADADLAPKLKDELGLMIEQYQAQKRRLGRLDYDDLLLETRALLRRDGDVRRYLQQRFSHLFIDEFQDTDPIQAEILFLLSSDDPEQADWKRVRPRAGQLFIVGDPKQSIYRFRHADASLYAELKAQMITAGVEPLELSRSFRAPATIQSAVNAAFQPLMRADTTRGRSGYVPLLGGDAGPANQPTLIALPVPRSYGAMNFPNDPAIKSSAPKAVGAFISWLLKDSGFTVRDPGGGGRVPVRARHIAILFKVIKSGMNDLARPYAEAIERFDLPHLLVDGRSFHRREEVEMVRVALAAIERPDDELSVYATLRSGLYGISDEILLRYKRTIGPLISWHRPGSVAAELEPVRAALADLDELNDRRNERPIVDTLHTLLERTRAQINLALRSGGTEALRNVLHLADLARAYELGGGTSFRGFVEMVAREAEATKSEGPTFEEAIDGVRLMTVHQAKGLEFPIVILAVPTTPIAWSHSSSHVDAQRGLYVTKLMGAAPVELREQDQIEHARAESEGVRVTYVAATRARDILVVPTIPRGPYWPGRGRPAGWLHPLDGVLYPKTKRAVGPAPGCPRISDSSTLEPDPEDKSVYQPGLYPSPTGDVVWWDPATLPVEPPQKEGIREERYLADDGGEASAAGRATYQSWREARALGWQLGGQKSMEILKPSEQPLPPSSLYGDISSEHLGPTSRGVSGKRFGVLVHQILRDIPFDGGESQVRALALMHARALHAPEPERVAAESAVFGLLGSNIWARARRAERAHREYPIMVHTPEGLLMDGVLDLVFLEDGVWFVVDWKTALSPSPEESARAEAQIAWYAHAMATATGAYARGIVVRF